MRNEGRTGRGRPKGNIHSQSDIKLLDYLALISVRYEVDSYRFFDKIVEAWNRQKSVCGNLLIECRGKFHNRDVFLITKGEKVVTQFHMPEYLLKEGNLSREFEPDIRLLSRPRKEDEPYPRLIKDLKAGMKKVQVRARVLTLSETREILTRFGSYARLTNAVIGDETGNIKFPLWNKQIDMVSLGDRIAIDNARVVRFRGELQLRMSRQGNIRTIETNEDLNERKPSRHV